MAFVLIDTTAVYILVNRAEQEHAEAKAGLIRARRAGAEPLLTNFIVAESHALMVSRGGSAFARRWLLGNTWRVERVTELDENRAIEIIRTYIDKDFSYTDATSFAVMERLGIRRALTFDRHFEQFGFEVMR